MVALEGIGRHWKAWCSRRSVACAVALCVPLGLLLLSVLPITSHAVKLTGGGAMTFSKWPFLTTSSYVYATCTGEDCNAAKGAVYVRINKTDPDTGVSQVFNIFGTHLQAWPEGSIARAWQWKEIANIFLPSLQIAEDGSEVIIYQGDMNADEVLYPEEVQMMLTTLSAKVPTFVGSQLFSIDPSTNFLVGKDGEADKSGCLDDYKESLNVGQGDSGVVPDHPSVACTNVPTTTASGKPIDAKFLNASGGLNLGSSLNTYCPCCAHQFIDYSLWNSDPKYLSPVASSIEIVPLKSDAPLTYKWGWCEDAGCIFNKDRSHNIIGNDLSDHYPTVANFIFQPRSLPTEHGSLGMFTEPQQITNALRYTSSAI